MNFVVSIFRNEFLLTREQQIPGSRTELFSFFEDPGNLGVITPPWLKFRILTPLPILMQRGLEIDYRIHWMGIPLRWRTRITEYDPPSGFVDEQIRGPYKKWVHQHSFEQVGDTVVMRDQVKYALPFGIVGSFVHFVLIQRQLKEIFDYRQAAIERIFFSD